MAAAPFKGTMIIKGVKTGETIHMPISFSDVVGEYAEFPDGGSVLQLGTQDNWAIVDLINETGGEDTYGVDVVKNNLSTSIQLVNKANLNTSNNRQLQGNPIGFKSGAQLRFKQI